MKKFNVIAEKYASKLGEWKDLIPLDTDCIVQTYNQGQTISYVDQKTGTVVFPGITIKNPLGILLEGRAELYEQYTVKNFTAYRPIRILKHGELFGDFFTIDDCLNVHNASHQKETWGLCAGFRSFLYTERVSQLTIDHFQYKPEKKDIRSKNQLDIMPHVFLDDILKIKTTVVFIDSSFVKIDSDFFSKLIIYSWPRVGIYRTALNSYNYIKKIEFKAQAKGIAHNFVNDNQPGGISKNSYLPLFLDAIWDAVNRPLRREPMFVVSNLPIDPNKKNLISDYDLNLKNFLVAGNYANNSEFWFPLDFANYIIMSYCSYDTHTYDSIHKNIGGFRTKGRSSSNNMRNSYIKIANIMFSDRELFNDLFSTEFDNYPYNIMCLSTPGGLWHKESREHIVLRFTKK